MYSHSWLCSLGAALLLCSPHAASGQQITFDFTGVITRVDDPLTAGPLAIGQIVSGSYTFDSTAGDQDPSAVVGRYDAVLRLELSVPAASYHVLASAGATPGLIEVLNDEDGVRDRYVVDVATPGQDVSGAGIAGHTLEYVSLVLRDRTTLALSSDALPLTPPVLADFAFGREIFLGFEGSLGDRLVSAELTSLTASSTATDLLDDLVQRVISLNLQGGVSNSLDAKLDAVMNAIDDSHEGNDAAARNAMYAFMNAVEAQRGKKLTGPQADQLIGVAQAVVAALGG
jgi:hypothetical protein